MIYNIKGNVGGCQYPFLGRIHQHSCTYIFPSFSAHRGRSNDIEYRERRSYYYYLYVTFHFFFFILHLPCASYPSLLPYQASVGILSDSGPLDHSWFIHMRRIERNEKQDSQGAIQWPNAGGSVSWKGGGH